MTAIELIEKWNNTIKVKQRFRLLGAIGCIGTGIYLLSDFNFRRGITYGQRKLGELYPEEYSAITKNLIDVVEKHYDLKTES